MTILRSIPSAAGGSYSIRQSAVAPAAFRASGVLESLGRRLVRSALSQLEWGSVRLIDPAGGFDAEIGPSRQPAASVRVLDRAFYAAAAFGGSLGVAEAYMDGLWETDDLAGLIEIMTVNMTATDRLEGPLVRLLSPLSRLAYLFERNTRTGSRRNIVAHYDLGNDFFAAFLDPSMTYSAAVFENGAVTLEQAQVEKIDRACRKLSLNATDHLLEIGTGWGALAIHAARQYGCRVTTTTISDEQHRFASDRVREAGLEGRIRLVQQDYRDLAGQYDKLVSIEMIEAVGRENFGAFFDVCSRCLKRDGAALIQSIVIRDQYFQEAAPRRDFLKKYIFPGSCLPGVSAMLGAVNDRTDLRLWHLEDIGPHYVTTLRMWREAFTAKLPEVRALGYDDRFIRMWEYYLAYCEGAFRARHVGDVQILLTKPMCRIPPMGERAVGRV